MIKEYHKQLVAAAEACFAIPVLTEGKQRAKYVMFDRIHKMCDKQVRKSKARIRDPREIPTTFALDANKNPLRDADGNRIVASETPRSKAVEQLRQAYSKAGEPEPFDNGEADINQERLIGNCLTFVRLLKERQNNVRD